MYVDLSFRWAYGILHWWNSSIPDNTHQVFSNIINHVNHHLWMHQWEMPASSGSNTSATSAPCTLIVSDPCPAQSDGRKLTAECQPGQNGLVVGILLTCTPSDVLSWRQSEGTACWLRVQWRGAGNLVVAQTRELATMYTSIYKYYESNRNEINVIEWQEARPGPGWWNRRDPGTWKESAKSGIESEWPICIGAWQIANMAHST